eukprot:TRINITY_DN9900_c0_g1_i1.p1 TRINITY_DN9900_c0_g1~~TRINITY_DN9900_c0_g1_i1.p1  ORF type:complete len:252 (-),score=61.49 TRINITY_DN9900_c0_g1_i1:196-951(-)
MDHPSSWTTDPAVLWAIIFVLSIFHVRFLTYWGRIVWTMIKSLPKAPLANMWESTLINTRVWPNDLDWLLHMNNSRYFFNMDFARTDWFIRAGYFKKILLTLEGISPVVGSSNIKYRRELGPLQHYQIMTTPVYFDERYFLMVQQFLNPKTKSVHAVSILKYAFLKKGKRMDPVEFFRKLGFVSKDFAGKSMASPRWREIFQDVITTPTTPHVGPHSVPLDPVSIPQFIAAFTEAETSLPIELAEHAKKKL